MKQKMNSNMNCAMILCLVKFIILQLIIDQSVAGQESGVSLSLSTRHPPGSLWNAKTAGEELEKLRKKDQENMRISRENDKMNQEISRQREYARQQEIYGQQSEERERREREYEKNEKYKRCTYNGREISCFYGKSCCRSGCCWKDGALFYHFWYVWLILGILALLGCIFSAIKCYELCKPSTPTQNVIHAVTTQATANCGANISTRHNVQNGCDRDVEVNFFRSFGQSEPLFTDFFNGNTNSNHNSNFITTTHHFDSLNPRANYSTNATHYSVYDPTNRNTMNQNSTPRSRNQSGRSSPVSRRTASAADEGVASDAPPSYFDAVYLGKGKCTNTPTAPEL